MTGLRWACSLKSKAIVTLCSTTNNGRQSTSVFSRTCKSELSGKCVYALSNLVHINERAIGIIRRHFDLNQPPELAIIATLLCSRTHLISYHTLATGTMVAAYQDVYARYASAGQEHVLKFYDSLSSEQQTQLLEQLESIDPEHVNQIYKLSVSTDTEVRAAGPGAAAVAPPPPDSVETPYDNPNKAAEWRQRGLDAIHEGKVGIILLAGGQGTRLGSSQPKGCYDIGLPSSKSLFQLQAERIGKLQKLAQGTLPWYVMTSGPTRQATEAFFQKNDYFGLDKQNVIFFNQGTCSSVRHLLYWEVTCTKCYSYFVLAGVLPALTNDGKIFLDTKGSVAVAPDGNGGIYAALRSTTATGLEYTVISDMKRRGIQYLYAYCVDNCLARVGDPVFLGYCISKQAQCGTKVVKKLDPSESVGVVALKDKKWNVIEYSEISKDLSEARDPNSKSNDLLFRAANIANHFYNIAFLDRIGRESSSMAYHIARKKIAHVDLESGEIVKPEKPNGMKLELFIFDVLPLLDPKTSEHAILEVDRKTEFSPLKNAPGTGSDDPQTSRRDLLELQRRWLVDAGATMKEGTEVELSPLVSYAGEDLEVVKGKVIKEGSHHIETQAELVNILL